MSVDEVKVLYTCPVCGRGFRSRQALAGHMNAHPEFKWKRLSVRLPADLVDRFAEICRKHKTTQCAVIHSLVQAVIQGDELGVVKIPSGNPLYVVIQDFYAAKPKARGKYVPPAGFEPAGPFEVPRCGYVQRVDPRAGEVFCSRARTWVKPEVCRGCRLQRGFIKLG